MLNRTVMDITPLPEAQPNELKPPSPAGFDRAGVDAAADAMPASELIKRITGEIHGRPDAARIASALTVKLNPIPDGGYAQANDETGHSLYLSNYPRSTAGALTAIIQNDSRGAPCVLLVHSRRYNIWELPGGYMEAALPANAAAPKPFDASLQDTATRETLEETGLAIDKAKLQLVHSWTDNNAKTDKPPYQQNINAYVQDLRGKGGLMRPLPQDTKEIDDARWVPLGAFDPVNCTFRDADGREQPMPVTHVTALNKAIARLRDNDIGALNANREALAAALRLPMPQSELGRGAEAFHQKLLHSLSRKRRPASFAERVKEFIGIGTGRGI